MRSARPPTIPPSVSITSGVSQDLAVKNSVSFFGSNMVGQQTVSPSLESVINLLKAYGLAVGWAPQGPKLVGTGGTGDQNQGCGVAIDGNTIVIGGYDDDNILGATWVFTRTDNTWSQQGDKLVGTGSTGGIGGSISQGYSVSIYGDTIVSPGYNDNDGIGATWVFTRTDNTWSQQGDKLIGTGYSGTSNQGVSVSIYEDTFCIGGYLDNNSVGAVWVYTRTNDIWTQQGDKLVGTGGTGNQNQGNIVSIYGDTLITGGFGDNNNVGAAWVFTRANGIWIQQGDKLVGTGYSGTSNQGVSVSIYEDTFCIGGYLDNNSVGAVWVYTRTNDIWTQQGDKLVGTGAIGFANQGYSVALYGDRIIIGGNQDNNNTGATWVFTRSEGVWTQQGDKIVGDGAIGNAQQGSLVSISDTTFVTGGQFDNNTVGAVWVFNY